MIKKIPSALLGAILIFGFLGFLDASFMATEHYLEAIPPCFVTSGCEQVTTSAYSKILGIPVAYLGTLYYLSVLVLGMYYVQKEKLIVLRLMHLATTAGVLFSGYLVYIQAFKIHAWCSYCIISASITAILFVLCTLATYKKWPAPFSIEEETVTL